VADATAAIKAITPDDEPTWVWVQYVGEHDLDVIDALARERVRLFMVYAEVNVEDLDDRGALLAVKQSLIVEARYQVPAERGGKARAHTLAAGDVARIKHQLELNTAWTASNAAGFDFIILKGSPRLRPLGSGAHHLRMEFEVHYSIAA
jgi:hypothetical protein